MISFLSIWSPFFQVTFTDFRLPDVVNWHVSSTLDGLSKVIFFSIGTFEFSIKKKDVQVKIDDTTNTICTSLNQ